MDDARTLRRWLIFAIMACAATYLIGNGQVSLWDRDEGWYAQCSKQMWETGNWVVPHFLDKLRTEKPVFVYWLQLGGYALFGGPSEFAVRFYASVAQTIVLCILAFGLTRLVGPVRATWATFIYGTCVMAIIAAKMCLTDATLMVFVATAMLCLMRFYLHGFSWRLFLLFSIALGFGGLTKGPVVFVPPGATLLVLAIFDWRRWWPGVSLKNVAYWAGVVLVCLLIAISVPAPWLITLYQREPAWIWGVLGAGYSHLTQSMDGHTGPFGYYLGLVWGTFFPWSLMLPLTTYVAWKQRKTPELRFAIAAVLGPWLFFEFMGTKLPHYALVTYPFLALLVADAIVRSSRLATDELMRTRTVVGVGIWAIPVGLVASLPWLAAFAERDLSPLPYVAMAAVSVAGLACTIGTWWFFYRRKPLVACGYMGGSFLLLIALTYGWLIPQCQFLRTSPRVAQMLKEHGGAADQAPVGDVVALVYPSGGAQGYSEPTLMFYQGGTIRALRQDKYLESTPKDQWPRLMVITDGLWARLPQATQDQLDVLGTVRGYIYSSGGDIVDVMVVRGKR